MKLTFWSSRAGSSDLVLVDTPDGCRPYDASARATQLVQGAPDCLYWSCLAGLAMYQSGWPLGAPPGRNGGCGGIQRHAGINRFHSSRLACLTDPADNAPLRSVAPGQLISLFGADLAAAAPYIPPGGVAQSSNTFGVFLNGILAPILD